MPARTDGLLDPRPLAELLRLGSLVTPVFEDAAVRAAVVATDLASGEAVVIDRGDTTSALLASSAFPGVFPPVEFGGTRLIDVGVAADIPVLQAEALGADECYVSRNRTQVVEPSKYGSFGRLEGSHSGRVRRS
ncbi:MAG: hypothetical protein QOE97_900 [Pseudonocardiales bacterium]|nr:hypothetical protein [Pseudonocardiales bacterium]